METEAKVKMDVIQALIKLQEVDRKRDRLQKKLDQVPIKLKEHTDTIARLEASIAEQEQVLRAARAEADRAELEVKTREDRREKLKADWKPKSEEHAKARDYLLKTWPALGTIQDFHESLGTLRNAVETCKKSGDKYAFRKLLGHFSNFAVKLNDLISPLDANSDSDRKALENAKSIRDVIGKLEQEVADFVKANP